VYKESGPTSAKKVGLSNTAGGTIDCRNIIAKAAGKNITIALT
jgi:hypothetical protein